MKKLYTEPEIQLKEYHSMQTIATVSDYGDNESDDPFGEL